MQTAALVNPRDLKAFLAAVSESDNRFDEATGIARGLVASGEVTKDRILKAIDQARLGSVLRNGAKNLLFGAFDTIMASKSSMAQQGTEAPVVEDSGTQRIPFSATATAAVVAGGLLATQYVLDNAQARVSEKKQAAPLTSPSDPSIPQEGAAAEIKSAVDRLKEEDAKRKTADRPQLTDAPRSR